MHTSRLVSDIAIDNFGSIMNFYDVSQPKRNTIQPAWEKQQMSAWKIYSFTCFVGLDVKTSAVNHDEYKS